nr:class I SAM-dependent methyltransferase [Halobacterium bonnevillei]
MDEARRTARTYEANADAYTEKYRGGSVAARHGDPYLDAVGDGRVLDAGCGPGSDAAVFADRGLDVVGLDVTRAFLREASSDVDGAFCRGGRPRAPVRRRRLRRRLVLRRPAPPPED